MNMKITGSSGVTKTGKKKPAVRAGATDAAAFTTLLNQASSSSEVSATTPIAPVADVHGVLVEEESGVAYAPTDPKERGVYMLETLEELEQDILAGQPTKAVHKLKEALKTRPIGYERLTPKQQAISDEIDLRVSVELAKLEG